jgi:hypothetical protein
VNWYSRWAPLGKPCEDPSSFEELHTAVAGSIRDLDEIRMFPHFRFGGSWGARKSENNDTNMVCHSLCDIVGGYVAGVFNANNTKILSKRQQLKRLTEDRYATYVIS